MLDLIGLTMMVPLIIAATAWMEVARVVQNQVRSLRERDFATAALMIGASDATIMFRELVPNVIGAIVVGGLVAIAISIGSVGLPGEISFIASVAPICMAMGVPIELLGLLVAVEAIPDIFRTVGNVSGDLAATVIAGKGEPANQQEGAAA